MADDDGGTRLGALMEARRVDLRLSWTQVAEKAEYSVAHLRKVRKGEVPVSPVVAAAIEDALQWERGSVAAIERGEDPTPKRERTFGVITTEPTEYPTDVAGDSFLMAIWDEPALEPERRAAVDGVIAYRLEERRKRRAGSPPGNESAQRRA